MLELEIGQTPELSAELENVQITTTSDFDELTNRPKYAGQEMTHESDIPEVKSADWDAKLGADALEPYRTASAQNEIDNAQNAIISSQSSAIADLTADIADQYDDTATYSVGDYVIHDYVLYRCITAIETAEPWTVAHWTPVALADDVANIVASAVKGVKVAGTELTKDADGKVDVPYATDSSAGVVKTNANYGTAMYGGNIIRVYGASNTVISNRNNAFMPITSTNLNLAVKSALSDANRISDMTDAEKKLACGVIGAVYDGDLLLVNDIELTEAASRFYSNASDGGVPYDYDDMIVVISSSSGMGASSYVRFNSVNHGEMTTSDLICNAYMRDAGTLFFIAECLKSSPVWKGFGKTSSADHVDGKVTMALKAEQNKRIKEVSALFNSELPIGTKIKVFAR